MELTPQEVWSRIQVLVRDSIPEHAYHSWIAGVKAVSLTADELVLEASNRFKAEWLEDKYGDLLESMAEKVLGRSIRIMVTAAASPDPFPAPPFRLDSPASGSSGATGPGDADRGHGRPEQADPFAGSFERSAGRSSSSPTGRRPKSHERPALNERYTFDRFVVGSNNQLASAAAHAAADQPGRLYNPLVLHGGVGLGKTHMMHAIGHALLERDPGASVAYVSAEQFMNELIGAIREGKTPAFRAKYREMDLLLVDDVQFLKGKETTQDEFFHTFNALYDSHRQIVLTSDRPPRDMEGLEERLLSRFDWGLAVDLRPPDLETRIAILRKKADDEGLVLDNEVIEHIAVSCTSSVRELEGAVIKLLAVSSVWHQDITPEFARRILALRRKEQEPRHPVPSPQKIQETVARLWRVRTEALSSKARTRNVTEARHVAMYVTRRILALPLKQIGEMFGGRDHSTVLYSIHKVEKRIEGDSEFRERVTDVLRRLQDSPQNPYPD
jgi:chromosomal replication initiator protein